MLIESSFIGGKTFEFILGNAYLQLCLFKWTESSQRRATSASVAFAITQHASLGIALRRWVHPPFLSQILGGLVFKAVRNVFAQNGKEFETTMSESV